MKKQFLLGSVLLIVSVLVLAGCNVNQDEVAMDKDEMIKEESVAAGESMTKEEMTKEEMMEEEKMEEEKMMKNEGKMAPAFELMSVSGETVSLESLKGEKVYVKFWASWCSICLAGLDEFDMLAAEAEGFKVISIVSPGYSGEQSKEKFVEWYNGLNYENLIVLLDEGGDIAKEYGVRGYPTSVYIGSDGVLVKSLPGHVSNDAIAETFKEIY